MLTQLNLYFKFSNVKSKSHLFTHLTYKVKAGLSRVGAAIKSNARNGTESKFPHRAGLLLSLLSLVSTSQELQGRKLGYLE